MNGFVGNLVAGTFANLLSKGIESGAKYVLSTRQIDMELRKSIETLQKRQLNMEGLIERLVNDQELLISLFASLIVENNLKSQTYIENQNIVIITDENDSNWSRSIIMKSLSNDTTFDSVGDDAFSEYHNYVKKMRRVN